MYMLMYMKMDCEGFKHGDNLIKFVGFHAMYRYYSDIVDMYAFGDHIIGLSTMMDSELSLLKRDAQ